MTTHRITYSVLPDGRYEATCRCGIHRRSRSTTALSAWGPEHVVTAYEREH